MADLRRRLLIALPPLIFAGFAATAWIALRTENRDELPSALIGDPAPALTAVTELDDKPLPTDGSLRDGGVTLVNFWASWCGPCRAEHPFLTRLAEQGVPVIGINYKDQPDQARAFLAELGDPYAAIGVDAAGRTGLDWGIYGVPETFVVDGDGVILMRQPGPLTPEVIERRVAPLLGD